MTEHLNGDCVDNRICLKDETGNYTQARTIDHLTEEIEDEMRKTLGLEEVA